MMEALLDPPFIMAMVSIVGILGFLFYMGRGI